MRPALQNYTRRKSLAKQVDMSASLPKTAEAVSECQTSYIEDTNLPTDNEGEEVGQGDIVQTECH